MIVKVALVFVAISLQTATLHGPSTAGRIVSHTAKARISRRVQPSAERNAYPWKSTGSLYTSRD